MPLTYQRSDINALYFGGKGQPAAISVEKFESAIHRVHLIIDQISSFDVDIFSILGMRNLSAFIGELYAASLIIETGEEYRKNPHQDGYPDLILMDGPGRMLYSALEAAGRLRDKNPFSPFLNGGLEVKSTCGDVPSPEQCRKRGLQDKPHIGDQRIDVLVGYNWKAHHRDTNNLVGILWDFIEGCPRIVGVFFCPKLVVEDWGVIVQPKDGGGRTTSVSMMTRAGVAKMYAHWMVVISSDPRYANFLNKYNREKLI